MLTLLLMSMLTLAFDVQVVKSEPTTIIVPDDYPTIQEAINTADNGDIIYVRNGTYNENVVVNMTVSLIGENKQTTIIDCEEHKGVVKVLANDVTIQNLTIKNSNNDPFDPPEERYSILVESNNTLIKNNLIAHETNIGGWYRGISLFQAHNNTITGNIMIDFEWEGIGIFLLQSSNNTIANNNITLTGVGIWMEESLNNAFYENIMVDNWYSGIICQLYSHYNNFTENTITGTNWEGIFLSRSQSNMVMRNTLANNGVGIDLPKSNNNTIAENTIIRNGLGIGIGEAYGNRILHNGFIDNTEQIYDYSWNRSHLYDPSVNVWDDGYPSGGNLWSDYNGTDLYNGLYQNITGKDGIGDTPYTIDENNQDNYPLILPIRNLDTGLYYATIQKAINAPETLDGHTIFVTSGIYHEKVIVNKTVSLIGDDETIIDGNSTGTVVHVIANNVSVKGFTIQNAGSHIGLYFSGIYLDNAYNCNITRNSILSNDYGIRIRYSSNNTVSGNMINCSHGIWLQWSSNNTVYGNNVTTSEWYSIWLDYSSGNAISRNIVTNGGYYGVRLYSSSNNILRKNSVAHNRYSFHITDSSHNTFSGNDIVNNDYGMFLVWSADNTIYLNNFINNTLQAYSDLVNTWDNGCQGNYWSDYNGTDLDVDGIGDTPYIIDENNTDRYPLMNRYWNPGDIDHDLDVDLFDAVRLLMAYGSEEGDENYNPHCDINEPYGAIDLFDAVLLLLNYGKKYS